MRWLAERIGIAVIWLLWEVRVDVCSGWQDDRIGLLILRLLIVLRLSLRSVRVTVPGITVVLEWSVLVAVTVHIAITLVRTATSPSSWVLTATASALTSPTATLQATLNVLTAVPARCSLGRRRRRRWEREAAAHCVCLWKRARVLYNIVSQQNSS